MYPFYRCVDRGKCGNIAFLRHLQDVSWWESNPRPPDHKSDALTTEPRCSTITYKISRTEVCNMMAELNLYNIWREKHPEERKYTWNENEEGYSTYGQTRLHL
ncbi:hypothetical protein ElyMa_002650600 [Elysia marginata]|uniref:Uncharacterized protein n=1 Tax=Elysia marginata TaxID=1093978 RepID=A0AAV4H6K4_9GAST|nr:hypothetical protein ElyMa_002650600 [Elysia marginata]